MAEPHGTAGSALGLGLLGAALGPVLAQWALIFVGGFLGACLAVAAAHTPTARAALGVLAKGIITSVLFTGLAATLAAPYVGGSVDLLLLPVAGLLGWRHDKLGVVADRLLALVRPGKSEEKP